MATLNNAPGFTGSWSDYLDHIDALTVTSASGTSISEDIFSNEDDPLLADLNNGRLVLTGTGFAVSGSAPPAVSGGTISQIELYNSADALRFTISDLNLSHDQFLALVASGDLDDFLEGETNDSGNDSPSDLNDFYDDNDSIDDFREGGSGDDDYFGGGGDDTLKGNDGEDDLFGEDGDDNLIGGSGNDNLSGGGGRDTLQGDDGDDSIQGNTGADSIRGGNGRDDLGGGQDDDVVRGGVGQDSVRGGLGNDELRGGMDEDRLSAGQGNDSLYGGSGDDYLDGKAHNDRLTGGAGADQFAFSNAPSGTAHVDTITDFEVGVDKIVLDMLAFGSLGGLSAGNLPAANFVSAASASAQDANDYILYDTTTHVLSYDADGSGSGAAQQIAVFENGAEISATDILIG